MQAIVSQAALCAVIERHDRKAGNGRPPADLKRIPCNYCTQHMICAHRPVQLKMDLALWSRAAVMQRIERECGMHCRCARRANTWLVAVHPAKPYPSGL